MGQKLGVLGEETHFFSVCDVLGAMLKCLKALKVFVTTPGLEFELFILSN